ncbi:hypothetical protein THAOC_18925 [Thalassiosira oceanica]|uniref:Uncharacterized protein n=1 Tax=Thalassiosira oceanica TaxID=159749 RepID=K0S736_THAOC|nr:hypothetical protein THAOC_18925 [Thalassiosira oceanica]|eukprot:EJK60679.1 hypothetical protein THAOC_18925 [Thalassiosira oceanica]
MLKLKEPYKGESGCMLHMYQLEDYDAYQLPLCSGRAAAPHRNSNRRVAPGIPVQYQKEFRDGALLPPYHSTYSRKRGAPMLLNNVAWMGMGRQTTDRQTFLAAIASQEGSLRLGVSEDGKRGEGGEGSVVGSSRSLLWLFFFAGKEELKAATQKGTAIAAIAHDARSPKRRRSSTYSGG